MSIAAMDFNSIINLGSLTALIGMGITFIMLFVLVGVISLTSKFSSIQKNTSKLAENSESLIKNELNENNLEIAAVMAAVYTMLDCDTEDIPKANFVVKSIRRISSGGQ